jgi:predicted transcriptional regulator
MNQNGGFYLKGEAYDETKYLEIISVYKEQERIHGSCSIRKLAKEANISTSTAKKALTFLEDGIITMKPKGRPKSGFGPNHGLTDKEHMFIYELYLDNPSRPVEDYCFKFWRKTGKIVSSSFISRWVNASFMMLSFF